MAGDHAQPEAQPSQAQPGAPQVLELTIRYEVNKPAKLFTNYGDHVPTHYQLLGLALERVLLARVMVTMPQLLAGAEALLPKIAPATMADMPHGIRPSSLL